MGHVVGIEAYRAERGHAGSPSRAEVFFDPACPSTYLAAERVERAFARVAWTPVPRLGLPAGPAVAIVERRAQELRLPLSWPEPVPEVAIGAMRAATLAAERGRSGAFVLAVTRLAFGGGFDPDALPTIAEAAAAARLDVGACLHAAVDERRDAVLARGATRLRGLGVDRLPAVRVGGEVFCGEQRIPEAAAAARRLRGAARLVRIPA